MSNEQEKAAKVVAPFGNGVDNSNVVYLAVSTTAASVQLPDEWKGKWIQVKLLTATSAFVFVSGQATTLPDASKVAADKQLGWPLLQNETEHYRLPEVATRAGHNYLCADASASGALYARLASE